MKNPKDKFDCAEVEKRVQQFIDGVLTEEETALIYEHIDFCLPCDKKIEFEKKLKNFIRRKAGETSYPPSLQAELKKLLK
jgi:anti-sigma factor (TIGR02949 family)